MHADSRAQATHCSIKKPTPIITPTFKNTHTRLQESQGLLWVFGDASPAGAAAAASVPLPLVEEGDQPEEWEPRTYWFMRDVPLSMETVVENVTVGCVLACVLHVFFLCARRERAAHNTTIRNTHATPTPPLQDPCHAPFTHHGVQGRRENEKGTVIKPAGPPTKVCHLFEMSVSVPFVIAWLYAIGCQQVGMGAVIKPAGPPTKVIVY